jgi:3-hydroxy-3-methylglutaryl CoA synthase
LSARREFGITGFGAYIPRLRMSREAIASAHRWMAPGLRGYNKGHRAFCNWDEDAVTMAVEAARDLLDDRPRENLTAMTVASTTMPFADSQSSVLIAGALGLPEALSTLDVGYSSRAATSGLMAALRQVQGPALFIASERPRAKPASVQEIGGGAGAVAFTLGDENVIAKMVASVSRHAMLVDHFRSEASKYDYWWEERWIRDEGYLKLTADTVLATLRDAEIAADAVAHFILPSPFKGVAAAVAKKIGLCQHGESSALDEACGYVGAAHGSLLLALVLESANPGDIIVLVGFGQGVDVIVLQKTDEPYAPRRGVSGALADMQIQEDYLRLAAYDNAIDLEWGMRAEKSIKTALTEQYRSSYQLANFLAGKCPKCGIVQFPQLPYCVTPGCNTPSGQFGEHVLYDEPARVLTYTADWLSYHPSPPLYVGFAQFEQGARLLMEIVDVGKSGLDVGTPLRMVYRIKDVDRARGYPRYFWKATPLQT